MSPARTYVLDTVWQDELCTARANRIIGALGDTEVITIGEADLPGMIADNELVNVPARGNNLPPGEDPIFVLNRLRVGAADKNERIDHLLKKCPEGTTRHLVERLLGANWTACGGPIRNEELICRRTNEFHTIHGCLHRCLYCMAGANQVVVLPVNLEEFADTELDRIVRENPWQKVFRYQTQVSDALCFEPEYGASKVFGDYFAGQDDRYLLLHTSSANTDHLLDLGHQAHTIVLWSLTSDTVSREIEERSATTEERIEAARRCQEAGYTVRFKFKPIVPVRSWRDECADMIEKTFAASDPDVVSLCVLMWMKAEEIDRFFDTSTLDPDCLRAMHEAADQMCDRAVGPFPDDVRTEIYSFFIDEIRKHNPTVPISLSTETKEVWDVLGPRMGFTPHNYVCGCGARCTPGLEVLDPPETFQIAPSPTT